MKGLFIKGKYKNEEFEFHAYEELGKVRLENKYKHDTFFNSLKEVEDFFKSTAHSFEAVEIN